MIHERLFAHRLLPYGEIFFSFWADFLFIPFGGISVPFAFAHVPPDWAFLSFSVRWLVIFNRLVHPYRFRYIVRMLGWARKYGLRVDLDIHPAPGSQNGFNHFGKSGSFNFLDEVHELNVLKRGKDISSLASGTGAQVAAGAETRRTCINGRSTGRESGSMRNDSAGSERRRNKSVWSESRRNNGTSGNGSGKSSDARKRGDFSDAYNQPKCFSCLLTLISSFIFVMLAVLALELIGWFIFLGLLISTRDFSSPRASRI
ncbi:hypothetical protein C8R45DRAFT_938415 [Mycena sanguinolenta]|nr:hypothetical protein C8R45DRAFT_938415 [Mycena sanguinolenta]